jgi:hypothetical protein
MRVFILAIISVFTLSTYAADGSSGCGPGWYVAKDNSLLSSALRLTTNGVLFPFVTLGMTFGTSNCSKHKIVKTEQRSLHYVTQNFYELKGDMAKGNGDFIAAYGKVIGCQSQDLDYFTDKMKGKFKEVFKKNNSNEEVLIQTYKVILSDEKLLQSCSLS